METAKAARAPPKASRGKVYILTLNAETAKILSEMAAEAHAAVDVRGTAAVASESTEAARHTRKRAAMGAIPRFTKRSESHPPPSPPAMANTGGIHASRAAAASVKWWTSTRYRVVQLVHSE
jgi:hypothetical protein